MRGEQCIRRHGITTLALKELPKYTEGQSNENASMTKKAIWQSDPCRIYVDHKIYIRLLDTHVMIYVIYDDISKLKLFALD